MPVCRTRDENRLGFSLNSNTTGSYLLKVELGMLKLKQSARVVYTLTRGAARLPGLAVPVTYVTMVVIGVVVVWLNRCSKHNTL